MTRRLQKNPELEWFKLENYEGLNSFTRYSWAKLIYLKQVCYNHKYLPYRKLMMYLTTSPIESDVFLMKQEEIKQAVEDTTNTMSDILLLQDKALSIIDNIVNNYESTDTYVSTKRKIDNIVNNYEFEAQPNKTNAIEHLSKLLDYFMSDFELKYLDIAEVLFSSKKKSITISLDFSDDELIHCFTKLLKELRKEEQEEGKRLSDNKLQKLVTNRVIPCIDLMLWSKFTGNKLTDQQMTDLLYPNGEIYLDSFRQGVKKRAKELLIERKPKFN